MRNVTSLLRLWRKGEGWSRLPVRSNVSLVQKEMIIHGGVLSSEEALLLTDDDSLTDD